MLVALRLTGVPVPSLRNVASIDLTSATDDLVLECVNEVWGHYSELGATDQVAKGTQLATIVFNAYKTVVESALRTSSAVSTRT